MPNPIINAILNLLNISTDETSSFYVNILVVILSLILLSFFCVMNIIIYFVTIILLDNENNIKWVSSKFPSFVLTYLKYFKKGSI